MRYIHENISHIYVVGHTYNYYLQGNIIHLLGNKLVLLQKITKKWLITPESVHINSQYVIACT